MDLVSKKCVPCEGGLPPFDVSRVKEYLAELPAGWNEKNSTSISKEFIFKNFKEAIAFVNRIATVAEAEGHHPDITVLYDTVKIDLSTHAIKGLSENDFILAAKIEKVVQSPNV